MSSSALLEAAREAGIRIALLDTCYLAAGFGRPPEGVQRRFSDGDADGWAERSPAAATGVEPVARRTCVVGARDPLGAGRAPRPDAAGRGLGRPARGPAARAPVRAGRRERRLPGGLRRDPDRGAGRGRRARAAHHRRARHPPHRRATSSCSAQPAPTPASAPPPSATSATASARRGGCTTAGSPADAGLRQPRGRSTCSRRCGPSSSTSGSPPRSAATGPPPSCSTAATVTGHALARLRRRRPDRGRRPRRPGHPRHRSPRTAGTGADAETAVFAATAADVVQVVARRRRGRRPADDRREVGAELDRVDPQAVGGLTSAPWPSPASASCPPTTPSTGPIGCSGTPRSSSRAAGSPGSGRPRRRRPPTRRTTSAAARSSPASSTRTRHLVFAGDRAEEFAARMTGTPYSAGGIRTTVAATRAATDEQLAANVARLVAEMRRQGTTTVEIKSGYGLTVARRGPQPRGRAAGHRRDDVPRRARRARRARDDPAATSTW